MIRTGAWVLMALGLLSPVVRAQDKGSVVELDGLKSRAPAHWKVEEPSSRMRSHQIRIPKVKGDSDDAELIVFYFGQGGGGSVEDNIKRWKGQFQAPEGKKIDDVSKVTKSKVGSVDLTVLEVEGIYLFKAAPFDPNARTEKKPDYRMVSVVFESPNGPYFIRFVGPAKTIGENKKAFDEWLKSFK